MRVRCRAWQGARRVSLGKRRGIRPTRPVPRAQETDAEDKESLTAKFGKSLGEKEQAFLDALRAFYYDGTPIMSNEEFDALKEELMWEGSKVMQISGTEQRFLEAYKAYNSGKPVLSDDEYDKLKQELRRTNSRVVVQVPFSPVPGAVSFSLSLWLHSSSFSFLFCRALGAAFAANACTAMPRWITSRWCS